MGARAREGGSALQHHMCVHASGTPVVTGEKKGGMVSMFDVGTSSSSSCNVCAGVRAECRGVRRGLFSVIRIVQSLPCVIS